MLTLKQISHLNAIIEYGTIHRAASAVYISQPALTRSINKLEQALGLSLFDRSHSGMRPTEFCMHITQRCQQIVLDVDDVKREADLYNALEIGTVNIGLGRALYELITLKILPAFASRYPQVKVELSTGNPAALLSAIESRKIELCLAGAGSFYEAEGIHCTPITDIPLLSLVRPGHPLCQFGQVSLSQLALWPMMMAQTLSSSHPLISYQNRVNTNGGIVCSNYNALKQTVLQTNHWMIAPAGQFTDEVQRGELIALQQEDITPTIELSCIALNGRSQSQGAQKFVELCRAEFPRV